MEKHGKSWKNMEFTLIDSKLSMIHDENMKPWFTVLPLKGKSGIF